MASPKQNCSDLCWYFVCINFQLLENKRK